MIAQQQLVELLPQDEQESLERFSLTRYKVRDDSQAEIAFYKTFP
ncbi:hypothetical protein [Pseudobacteriovorax antillogorgiicola]|nr:hypothetical protein [Pseudobacteriovorax antillogorgiicola]